MDFKKPDNIFSSRHLTGLIGSLERERRAYINSKLENTGLRNHQFWALIHLSHYPGINQEDLANALSLDTTRMARSCKELEDMGYLHRERDPENRRQYRLYLTDQGNALLPEIRTVLNDWSNSIAAGITMEQVKMVIEVLEQMDANASSI